MTQLNIFTRKVNHESDVCSLVVNGYPCAAVVAARGICTYHAQQLRANGRYEEFALPPITGQRRRHEIVLKPPAELRDGVCRVAVNGTSCESPAQRRGLCSTHYAGIWQRDDLNLEDFCAQTKPREFRRRKVVTAGVCRVREGGADCQHSPHARGLCKRHYAWLRENSPHDFNAIAEPDPGQRRWALRRDPKSGRCRAEENSIGCGAIAFTRGLCKHHLNVLRSKPALLEQIALSPKQRRTKAYTKKVSFSPVECIVIDDGTPCREPASRRGLCQRHRKAIWTSKAYALEDFELPEKEFVLRPKSDAESVDGLCRAVVNEALCAHLPNTRGLCRMHYRLAERLGLTEQFSKIGRAVAASRVQVYLDKNIIIDYLDQVSGLSSANAASLTVMDAIHCGRLVGCISTDAIKSAYNRLRHRLTRRPDEGGIGCTEEEAEAKAQAAIGRLLKSLKHWRIVSLDAVAFLNAFRNPGGLSLEDALEWMTYQVARAKPAGPIHFITRDADFEEGLHPAALLKEIDRQRTGG